MLLTDRDVEDLRSLEEDLLRPEVRRSPRRLDALIADGFREFGSSGRVFDKAEVMEAAERLPDVRLPLADFRAEAVSVSVALVTYRSATRRAGGDEKHALRSSLWVRSDDGGWRLVFHQGTPAASATRTSAGGEGS